MITEQNLATKSRAELAQLVQEQQQQLANYLAEIESLRYQKSLLLQKRYGRSKDSAPEDGSYQLSLFDEAGVDEGAEASSETSAVSESEATTPVASHRRRRRTSKPLPKDLPRYQVDHDLHEAEKWCGCGHGLTCIGSDTNEQLDFVPARVHVWEHHRYKYACYHCEDTVKTARYQHQPPIAKSMAAPGLLSHVVVSKFQDHLPLYRQAAMFQRMGVELDRKTLSNWLIQVGRLLQPLIKLMQARLQAYDIAYADETPVQVLKEHGRSAHTRSYMWVFMGGQPSEFSILYHYAPSRGSAVARRYLSDFKGVLHCDAYSAYQALTNDPHTSVQLAACWAHVRRKFVEITQVMKQEGLAHQAVRQINRLYRWERWAKQQGLDAEATRQMRQQHAQPLVEQFEAWCQRHRDQVPPKSGIGAAIQYTLNHMASLKTYLSDGRLEMDNNRAERAIKPFVTGRKNWLFMGNADGAEAAATIFSLVETCRHHGLDPYSYFKYVLTHIRDAETMEQLEQLLPYYVERQALLNQYRVTDVQ